MAASFHVYISDQIEVDPSAKLPFTGLVKWSPISSTLICFQDEALLVDTAITIAQNEELADWIESTLQPHQKLTKAYITHGHVDHFMGIPTLKARFPDCRILATSGTVEHIKQSLAPSAFSQTWAAYFPGSQLANPNEVEIPETIASDSIHLKNLEIRIVEVGHTDTYSSTALFVPELSLAVCGDAVYGDVHQMLREANTPEKRQEWISGVQKIKDLQPQVVIPGHSRIGDEFLPRFLDSTIKYIRDFGDVSSSGAAGLDSKMLFDAMMAKHGGRLNAAALEVGCHAAFPPPPARP